VFSDGFGRALSSGRALALGGSVKALRRLRHCRGIDEAFAEALPTHWRPRGLPTGVGLPRRDGPR